MTKPRIITRPDEALYETFVDYVRRDVRWFIYGLLLDSGDLAGSTLTTTIGPTFGWMPIRLQDNYELKLLWAGTDEPTDELMKTLQDQLHAGSE